MANTINTVIETQAQDQVSLLLKNLQGVRQEIIKTSEEARKMNAGISGIKTPSGLSGNASANAQLVSDLKKQSDEIKKLQTELTKLNEVRSKSNQRTQEEITNNRILAQNANRQVLATSQLAGAYRNLSAQVAIASEKYQNLIARGKTAEQTQKQFNNELKTAQREFRTLQNRVLEADKAVDKWGRTGERSIGFAKNLLSAFGVVGGVTLFATMAQDVFKQVKEMQSLDLALKTVTGTQEKFYESQAFLNRIAEDYGAEINTLTTSFTQFYAAAKDKISGDQIKSIFESVSKSAGFLGLSVEKQEKAFLALNQMMSKGTIQAEELRGQLSEALPGSMGIMVKAVQALNPNMKVTEQTIAKMMKDGKLLASEVLPEFAKQMEISYGVDQKNRVETLTASTTRMGNTWKELIRSFNESETGGLSAFFKFFTDGINGAIKGLIRLNSSWDDLIKKAKEKGEAEGGDVFSNFSKGLDEKQVQEKWGKYKAKFMAEYMDFYNKLVSRKKERDELQKAGFSTKIANEDIELLQRAVSKYEGFIKKRNEALKPKEEVTKTKEISKEEQKAQEDRLKLIYDNAKKELEIQIYKQEKIYSNEKLDYRVRLKALEEYNSLKGELAQLDYNEEVRLAKGNDLKIVGADLDKKFQLIKNLEDYTDKKEKLEIDSVNKLTEAGTKEIKTTDLLAEAKKKGAKEFDDYTKKINEQAEALARLQSMTDDYINSFSDSFLSNAGLSSFNTFLDGSFKAMFNSLDGTADEMRDKFALTFNAISEVAQEAFSFINEASQKNYDEEYSRLEEQKNVAILYAGESTEAKKKIEDDYEKRKKEIANREAKAKKKMALFNIVVDTAQAVVSAISKYDYPSAILFGLIGAAQYATVSSQEIPRYFKGGKHKGGLAMINDGGGSNYVETIVTPDGKATQYSGRNVITDLPAGSEIFTPEQMKAKIMMPNFELKQNRDSNGNSDQKMNELISTVKNKKELHLEISQRGIITWSVEQQKRTQMMNDRFEFKQTTV